MWWARQAGVDLLADPVLAERLARALRAPATTALPDSTFPARKDSRFGVSLAQPMYLELWEIGLARVGGARAAKRTSGAGCAGCTSHLRRRRRPSTPISMRRESPRPHRCETGRIFPGGRCWRWFRHCRRRPPTWSPGNVFIEGQGLAVLRQGDRYASLEAGAFGGGHGHPDRLNLVVHANGEYWLPDFGTGSYVARDLFWYRSTLAHNAPRLDGVSQAPGDAVL